MLRETRTRSCADPRGVYVDGTFGRGGHSRGILGALAPEGRLHAFDMDPEVRTGPERFPFRARNAPFEVLVFRVPGFRLLSRFAASRHPPQP